MALKDLFFGQVLSGNIETIMTFLFCNADSGGGSSLGSKLKSLSPDSFVRLLQEIFKIVQVMYAWQLMLLVQDYTCKFIY